MIEGKNSWKYLVILIVVLVIMFGAAIAAYYSTLKFGKVACLLNILLAIGFAFKIYRYGEKKENK